jgi:hypothetical protein
MLQKNQAAKGGIKGDASSGFCEQLSAARVTTGSKDA